MMVLVISGSMGAGKTTVMAEASDLLAEQGIAHAALDLDALSIVHGPAADDLMYANLTTVWANYSLAGVTRLLVASAVESTRELDRLHAALANAEIVVCRLRAPVTVMEARVRQRESGIWQDKYVSRVAKLEHLLTEAGIEDFSIVNNARLLTEVARELLRRAGWMS